MNLDFSPEDVAFRDEVRAFIASDYPAEIRAKQDAGIDLDRDDYLPWRRVMARKGWVDV